MFPYIIKLLIIYLSHSFAVSISADWVNFKDGLHTSREQWGKHHRKLKKHYWQFVLLGLYFNYYTLTNKSTKN